jgi:Ca2+-binding EF-hand superfamily protein
MFLLVVCGLLSQPYQSPAGDGRLAAARQTDAAVAPKAADAAAAPDPTSEAALNPATVHLFLIEHDLNRDGKLTLEELPDPLRRRFARADLDGNGELDPRELLVGPSRISREARRAEGLRLTRRGLEKKSGPLAPGSAVEFRVSSGLLQRLDHNKDGYADTQELGTILREPDVLFGDRPYSMTVEEAQALAARLQERPPTLRTAPPLPSAHVPSAFDPNLVTSGPELPTRPDIADITAHQDSIPKVREVPPTAPPQEDRAEPTASRGANAMPDAKTILEHLDKNGNGQLDRSEAVDQLADNFDRLDRNRDNMLSEKEISRGLALAKMFGIKPKQDPRTYRAHKPSDDPSQEPYDDNHATENQP